MHDFSQSARDQIRASLALATETLGEMERELKELEHRTDELRTFVRLGAKVLGTLPPPEDPPRAERPEKMTAMQKICLVLTEENQALSIPAIMDRLESRGLIQRSQHEAVKSALRSYPSVFTRPKRGIYGLVAQGEADAPHV